MLGRLKAIDEGNGKSLLDNMLFFWTNELGEGGKHTYVNVPMVLAGSCGGQLPTGRYLDYLGRAAGRRTGTAWRTTSCSSRS